ncbi:tripartite tricarboxylate transporter substrate-binding protein [Curvibacter sp. RS43]|uniref:Tripartite tricarboxylate transporter substrate-binding protein n=1 Tax=Curvibacter microcysteis TaxID=3026419 RepID=A0ABT5MCC8_9BURK|nr:MULTISPECIES: tripartite tricarboxylate transporter substrate-binding protein [unclassified Curvibacter]MDD0809017.1 tripartite tricarboxylate transporter substrate-binding protein [Curvibacter sp. RS43]MDD0814086.1 tripartite tricarboxylate transporter substrate-binding protein [Curvibacter sp. HBC28]
MTSLKTLKRLALGTLAAACLLGTAQAQTFPDKPITMLVPFAAGGPTDVVARMIAIPMGKALGQTVLVENAAGAGGTIAATKTARSAPNGYTIFLHHMGMSTAPALYKKLTFDPLKDFDYIGQVVDVPMTLLARKDLPANTLPELLSYIKANREKVTLANAGLGAVSHLCGLLFMSAIDTDLNTIPYKGTGPAMNDLLGGQVDLLCDQTTQTVPMIKEGRVKVFGVTTLKRLGALPNVPTLDEQGLKGFEVKVWHGMYAPKGTPPEVLKQLNAALRTALADPAVVKRLNELSSDVPPQDKITPEGLRTHLEAEINKWGPVIRKAGIYAD